MFAGERVILVYPPGLDFIVAHFGCLMAGCIAVPVYPPVSPGFERGLRKLAAVASNSGSKVALTSKTYSFAYKVRYLPCTREH